MGSRSLRLGESIIGAGKQHPHSLPPLAVLPLCALKDSPVNLYSYPRPKQERSRACLGKEGFFLPDFPNCLVPPCPAVGDGTSMCAPVLASALGSAERQPGTWEGSGAAFPSHGWSELTGAARQRCCPWEQDACVRLTLAAHLHLAQSQALACPAAGMVTLVVACFPFGTQAFLLRPYKCCATNSSLLRKGRHDPYGVKFPQRCSTSSFHAAAWLPSSGSAISLAMDFFRALLAVRCLLLGLQGEPGGTLPVPSDGEGASSFHGWLLPITGGSFAEGSCELLHLESVWACWSGGGKRCATLLQLPAAPVLLPAWDVPPRGTFMLQAAPLAWQQKAMPPTTSETTNLLLS